MFFTEQKQNIKIACFALALSNKNAYDVGIRFSKAFMEFLTMADELIDIYDENMNLLGTAMKSQAHREGLWHKTFHCWLARKNDEGKIMVWLQLRNNDKSIYPDMLDVSAAGHVKSGEEVKDGYREVTEELGLCLQKDDLVKMFTIKEIYQNGDIYNREFEVLYMAVVDNLLAKVKLQPEEVAGLYEVELEDFVRLINGDVNNITAYGVHRNNDNTYTWEVINVAPDRIAGHSKEYYLKSMEMLRRYVEKI